MMANEVHYWWRKWWLRVNDYVFMTSKQLSKQQTVDNTAEWQNWWMANKAYSEWYRWWLSVNDAVLMPCEEVQASFDKYKLSPVHQLYALFVVSTWARKIRSSFSCAHKEWVESLRLLSWVSVSVLDIDKQISADQLVVQLHVENLLKYPGKEGAINEMVAVLTKPWGRQLFLNLPSSTVCSLLCECYMLHQKSNISETKLCIWLTFFWPLYPEDVKRYFPFYARRLSVQEKEMREKCADLLLEFLPRDVVHFVVLPFVTA